MRPKRPRKPLARAKTPIKASGRIERTNGPKGLERANKATRARGAAWATAVKERDKNQCQWPGGCKSGDFRLDAHHKAKRSQRPDLKFDIDNGITLCRIHHDWTDANHDEAVRKGLLNTESYEIAHKA